jgi:hypothetical protein
MLYNRGMRAVMKRTAAGRAWTNSKQIAPGNNQMAALSKPLPTCTREHEIAAGVAVTLVTVRLSPSSLR